MHRPTLGIIGGGQLGSLLADAAKKIGIKTVILSDDIDAPGKSFSDKFIFGNYDDQKIINEFVNSVDLVTYEFENIPFNVLKKIDEEKTVLPKPDVNNLIQNRLTEKDFLNKINIQTTKYKSIDKIDELKENKNLIPGLLKTTTLGYDGKGQYRINKFEDINNNIDFNKKYILEKLIILKKEISVVITRFGHQKFEIYEPIENVHEDQILKHSKIPADISDKIYDKAINWSTLIAEELDYIGTLCIEFFIDKNDNLYANEIAPRVHNSGHLTINAFNISQFENHVRAVCDLGHAKVEKISNAEMFNILGKDIETYRSKKFNDDEFFYDYEKKSIKDKRKMGHLTVLKK